ncbi:MAG: HEAT repeat domain-containing protein [Desulfuromonadales bacterium]
MTDTTLNMSPQLINPGLLDQAADFIQSLLQAFQRTGYYLHEHPEAQKAKAGLYEKFNALAGTTGELTFLKGEDHGRPVILVEGILHESLRLVAIMNRSVAETSTAGFMKFFERKEIISISLSSRLDQTEFSNFIDVMSEQQQAVEGENARERFIRSLQELQICNISVVYSEDVVITRANLPWRARLALSRLKKDVRMLPILRSLSVEKLRQLKQQILADILRPMGMPDTLYAFLINLDLAASPLMTEEDAEAGLFSVSSDRMLTSLGDIFMKQALTVNKGFPEHITNNKIGRILAGLCQRLNSSKDPEAAALLETLFVKGLISINSLPQSVRIHVLTIKRLATFLTNPEKFLRAFDGTTDPGTYATLSNTLAAFVPLLVEKEHFVEAEAIVRTFNFHALEKSDRGVCAIQRRGEIIFSNTLANASQIFLTASKETRTRIGYLFQQFGQSAVPHLQRILIESDDPWRSKQAAETLISIGDSAVVGLINSIESNLLNKTSLPVSLRVLSEVLDSSYKNEIVALLKKYSSSIQEQVRREALSGLVRLCPASGFERFCSNLNSEDYGIRRIAVRGLGMAGDNRGFTLLKQVIDTAEQSSWNEGSGLAVQAVESLAVLAGCCPVVHSSVATYIGELVEKVCKRQAWKQIIPGATVIPPQFVLALIEAISRLRGPTVQSHLTRLADHRIPEVARRATELSRLHSCMNLQAA